MIDHATGVVIGETAVVEDDVSIMQDVTLGGTGKESGDRHPKIRRGVLLSLGAKILGNIEVGEYSRVGAGSVVLKSVPPGCTAVGVPAKLVNCDCGEKPVAGDEPFHRRRTAGQYWLHALLDGWWRGMRVQPVQSMRNRP